MKKFILMLLLVFAFVTPAHASYYVHVNNMMPCGCDDHDRHLNNLSSITKRIINLEKDLGLENIINPNLIEITRSCSVKFDCKKELNKKFEKYIIEIRRDIDELAWKHLSHIPYNTLIWDKVNMSIERITQIETIYRTLVDAKDKNKDVVTIMIKTNKIIEKE